MRRDCQTPLCPAQIEEQQAQRAAPTNPPARPSRAASARNSRRTRRVAPPMAFIKPTSFLRSIATLVMAAITHKRRQHQHERNGCSQQSTDAVVNFCFGIGELAQSMYIRFRNLLLQRCNIFANFLRRASNTQLHQTDFSRKPCESLGASSLMTSGCHARRHAAQRSRRGKSSWLA